MMRNATGKSMAVLGCLVALSGLQACGDNALDQESTPPADSATVWPKIAVPGDAERGRDVEAEVEQILAAMTLEEKVGQILQPQIGNITPAEVAAYNIGSVFNGGDRRPNNDPRASREDWLALADAYYDASVDTSDGGVGVPLIWGIDAVHGNNGVYGATVFPHNIGLGAADDIELMRDIGRITALETAALGLDWTFAPAVSVARDDRWGRTYESFSESPAIVARLSAALVEGLQGDASDGEAFLGADSIVATAKHFLGDGGTTQGQDRGNTEIGEQSLADLHAPGYASTGSAGVQTVMASYSQWNGVRLHGHQHLLTGVLKDEMGFDGFVVGDYNGHALIPGCTAGDCPDAFIAGIDMYMVPTQWKEMYESTLRHFRSGKISQDRLDDAVRRILRVKVRAGLFSAGRPSTRAAAKRDDLIGNPAHRALARQAARASLVLLKNQDRTLPFDPASHVLVAGDGADNIAKQVGGWSINWQGTGLPNDMFPNAQSVFDGVRNATARAGGSTTLSEDGSFEKRPDLAIVVFGEDPYAEFQGDRESLLYDVPSEDDDLALLGRLRSQGIPTVAVFISGRPLWVNHHINAADAFIAAFLPGTEGGAIADLVFSGQDAGADFDFTGRLSFSWPSRPDQTLLNDDEDQGAALFPLGYGLSSKESGDLAALDVSFELPADAVVLSRRNIFYADGRTPAPWRMYLGDSVEPHRSTAGLETAVSAAGGLTYTSVDWRRQADSKVAAWNGSAASSVLTLGYQDEDYSEELDGNYALVLQIKVLEPAAAPVYVSMGTQGEHPLVDISSLLGPPDSWQKINVPLSCFADAGTDMSRVRMPFKMETSGTFSVQIADIRLSEPAGTPLECAQAP